MDIMDNIILAVDRHCMVMIKDATTKSPTSNDA